MSCFGFSEVFDPSTDAHRDRTRPDDSREAPTFESNSPVLALTAGGRGHVHPGACANTETQIFTNQTESDWYLDNTRCEGRLVTVGQMEN